MEVIVLTSSYFIPWGGVIALGMVLLLVVAGAVLAIIFGAISLGKRMGRERPVVHYYGTPPRQAAPPEPTPPRGPAPPSYPPPADGMVGRNYCPYCGIRLYNDASFCANCGRDVERIQEM